MHMDVRSGGTQANALEALTGSIDWEIKVLNMSKLAEDLLQVAFVDVLSQALNNDLIREPPVSLRESKGE